MKTFAFMGSLLLVLCACSTQVDYIANSSGRAARPAECDIDVYLPGSPIENQYEIIGSVLIGDNGLSMDCGQDTVIKQAKNKGCQVGADAILLNEIKEPDWISTCYRIKGSMLLFKIPQSPSSPSFPSIESNMVEILQPKISENIVPPSSSAAEHDTLQESKEFEPIPFD